MDNTADTVGRDRPSAIGRSADAFATTRVAPGSLDAEPASRMVWLVDTDSGRTPQPGSLLVHHWSGTTSGAGLTANLAVHLGWQVRGRPLRVLLVFLRAPGDADVLSRALHPQGRLAPISAVPSPLGSRVALQKPSVDAPTWARERMARAAHRPELNADVLEVRMTGGRRTRALLDLARASYDYVLIDVPPTLSDNAAAAAVTACDALVVSTDTRGEPSAAADAAKLALALADTARLLPRRCTPLTALALRDRPSTSWSLRTSATDLLTDLLPEQVAVRVPAVGAASAPLAVTRNDEKMNHVCFTLLRHLLPHAPLEQANSDPMRRAARQALLARLRHRTVPSTI